MSIDELKNSLIVHVQKFQRHKAEEQVLKVTHEEDTGGRGRGRKPFRGEVEDVAEVIQPSIKPM